jgi:hypothetical protein
MTCKGNCAAYVSINMPHARAIKSALLLLLRPMGADMFNTKSLDAIDICGIIVETIDTSTLRKHDAH